MNNEHTKVWAQAVLEKQRKQYAQLMATEPEPTVVASQRNPPSLIDALKLAGRNIKLNALKAIVPNPDMKPEEALNYVTPMGLAGAIRKTGDAVVHIPELYLNTSWRLSPPHGEGFEVYATPKKVLEDNTRLQYVQSLMKNYAKKTWATENDPIVKLADEGLNVFDPLEGHSNIAQHLNIFSPASIMNNMYPLMPKGTLIDDIPRVPTMYAQDFARITDKLQTGGRLTKGEQANVEDINLVATMARNIRGTEAVAQTKTGRLFENVNDLAALERAMPNIKDYEFLLQNQASNFKNRAKLFADKEAELKSPYLNSKEFTEDPNRFILKDPFFRFSNPGLNSSITKSLYTSPLTEGRTSFIDALRMTNVAGHEAAEAKVAEEYNKRLSTATPVVDYKALDIFKNEPGFTWHELDTNEALHATGEVQENCLKKFDIVDSENKIAWNPYDKRRAKVFSLRNPHGRPVVNVEIDADRGEITQVFAKANSAPSPRHFKYIKDFLNNYLPDLDIFEIFKHYRD
jgi:hypothetical protein